jgi:hypothetical protein
MDIIGGKERRDKRGERRDDRGEMREKNDIYMGWAGAL